MAGVAALVVAVGSAGDTFPLLGVAHELKARGASVR